MIKISKDFNFGINLSTFEDDEYLIFILKMTANDNRFNPNFCDSLSSALDFVMNEEIPKHTKQKYSLVITGSGRFFSNGLDLKYLISKSDPNLFLIKYYEPLIYKFLTLGIPTIALVNGHAFAGGMCLALAQDYRLASSEGKALLSMNELLIRASIPAGMLSVLRAKLASPQILRDCIHARRWTIPQAQKDGIIDEIFTESELLNESIKFAKSKAIQYKYIEVLHSIKEETYHEASALLLDPKSDKFDPFRFALPRNKI
jgi:Delta3-Delta2-enoyl-CoA isomerase